LVFGYENDELQDVVVRRLKNRRETLSVVEWGSAGLIAHWFAQCRGADEVFESGLVVQSHVPLASAFPVACESWGDYGFRSAEFTRDVARAARRTFGTDWVLVIGPFPAETDDDRAAFFALSTKDGVVTKAVTYAGHPSILQARAAKQALDWLLKRATPQSE
jgi:nicotinamide-nucleotide amidase